jgi:hypothetical protein
MVKLKYNTKAGAALAQAVMVRYERPSFLTY